MADDDDKAATMVAAMHAATHALPSPATILDTHAGVRIDAA